MPFRQAILALSFVFVLPLSALAEHPPIGFQSVNAQVYRGGRPATLDSMGYLARIGIRTVVNLQGSGWQILPGEKSTDIAEGRSMAESLGMRYFHLPLAPGGSLDAAGVKTLLEIVRVMEDPRLVPVYVHCNVGADRTGLAVAAYRILHEGCSFDSARAELNSHGAPWTPILMGKEIAFLRELAAAPEKFGHARATARCTL